MNIYQNVGTPQVWQYNHIGLHNNNLTSATAPTSYIKQGFDHTDITIEYRMFLNTTGSADIRCSVMSHNNVAVSNINDNTGLQFLTP